MNKNDHGKVWFLDPTGMPTAGWGLSLSAYEMAQIGLMVLNNGVYNDTRMISENWIEMMIKSYISTDEKFGNQDYGFLWWLPHRTREVIAAIGDGGNIIYVDRKNQIVVAITAHFKPMVFDRVEYIEKNIVEALTERWGVLIAIIKIANIILGYACEKQFIALHTIMNKVTGFLLFLLPLTISLVDLNYSLIVVCCFATFSAVQEGIYILKNSKNR